MKQSICGLILVFNLKKGVIMIYLDEIKKTSFVLLRSNWTVNRASQILSNSKASHVIIHRTEPEIYGKMSQKTDSYGKTPLSAKDYKDYYYLYPIEKMREVLKKTNDIDNWIKNTVELHEYTATPITDAYSDAVKAPLKSIIMDSGRITGFVDPDASMPADPPQAPKKSYGPASVRRNLRGSSTRSVPGKLISGNKEKSSKSNEPVPRYVKADFPEEVAIEQTVSLLVSIAALKEKDNDIKYKLPVAVPTGTKLDFFINPLRGFTVEGPSEASIIVSEEEEFIKFSLKANELGQGEIRVLIFNSTKQLGTIILKPLIKVADQARSVDRIIKQEGVVSVTAHEPDLYFLILEEHNEGKTKLTYRLKAKDVNLGLQMTPFGPIVLQKNPQEYFSDFFSDIEKLKLDNDHEKEVAKMRLESKGTMLFQQLIPPDLQALLWSLKDRIQSVQIHSLEPDIPWELCRLQGKENGIIVDGPFFCQAFAMTRCLDGIASKPSISLKKLALVVPKDSGLKFAVKERDFILSLAKGGRKVDRIPANFVDVKKALSLGEYDCLHFTGHGGFDDEPNHSAIKLENDEELIPEDLSDSTKNLGRAKPLVFLNACQIGRSAMSLTDIGGWAAQFLRADASAFIGAYWSVYDESALVFAKALYDNLLAGMEIGMAVNKARNKIKSMGDPTWLAYTVFADPLAKVS